MVDHIPGRGEIQFRVLQAGLSPTVVNTIRSLLPRIATAEWRAAWANTPGPSSKWLSPSVKCVSAWQRHTMSRGSGTRVGRPQVISRYPKVESVRDNASLVNCGPSSLWRCAAMEIHAYLLIVRVHMYVRRCDVSGEAGADRS